MAPETAWHTDAGDEPPLRSELFSSDQMKQYGKNLRACTGGFGSRPDRLLTRLAENEGVLIAPAIC